MKKLSFLKRVKLLLFMILTRFKINKLREEFIKVGDIYIGIVESILPSLNAAFVVLNHFENNGFMHLNNKKKKNKKYSIIIMIYLNFKEPSGKKGPSVRGDIILQGRYLNLSPFNQGTFFINNIEQNYELQYLKAIFSLLRAESLGLIVKSFTLYVALEKIIQDFYTLLYEWDFICKNKENCFPPYLISKHRNFISNVLQKIYTDKINNIVVDSYQGAKKVAFIIEKWSMDNNSTFSIKYFNSPNFLVYDYNLDLIIYDLLQPRVNLVGGGYIFIEKTEALTTIDVNSGSCNYLNNPRETIFLVNCKAAKQIAKNIKLRNISGLIIIDFIDMQYQKDQLKFLLYFDSLLQKDNEKTKIVQLSELGLVELTRKRQGKTLSDVFASNVHQSFSLLCEDYNLELSNFSFQHVFLDGVSIYSI
uniref:Ribonuclease E n=1 Tax=Storeatula sp. CCMP1868 TaxID=195070 RepID=A0A222AHQ4_9CRYP|nr:ribonuclease E [Storeatula sp. CCMP1868]